MAMILAPCTSVFGLIGFSGRAGREGEPLALMDSVGDGPMARRIGGFCACMPSPRSWNAGKSTWRWPTSSALAGSNIPATRTVPAIRAHASDQRERRAHGGAGVNARPAGHLIPRRASCTATRPRHIALWALEPGEPLRPGEAHHAHLKPGASWGPPINTLTDSTSFSVSRRSWFRRGDATASCGASSAPMPARLSDTGRHLRGCARAPPLTRACRQQRRPGAQLEKVAPAARAADGGACSDGSASLLGALVRGAWGTRRPARATGSSPPDERIGGSRAQRDLHRIIHSPSASCAPGGSGEGARLPLSTAPARRAGALAGIAESAGASPAPSAPAICRAPGSAATASVPGCRSPAASTISIGT